MANSKSTIYPIQLQNAELNLNKYDAEIKQYSGFNKNNAPFVGGCLSNIFTKNEIIEGSNGENVYIAPNGDIYQVTTEGLFKNDEKIIEYPENSKFYAEEEVILPENLIYYYNDDVYITQLVTNKIELNCLGIKKTVDINIENAAYFIEHKIYNEKDFYIFVTKQHDQIKAYFFYDDNFLTYYFDNKELGINLSDKSYFEPCIKFASADETVFTVIQNCINAYSNNYDSYSFVFQFDLVNQNVSYLHYTTIVRADNNSTVMGNLVFYYFTKDKYYLIDYRSGSAPAADSGNLWLIGTYDLVYNTGFNKYYLTLLTGEYTITYKKNPTVEYKYGYSHILRQYGVLYTLSIPSSLTQVRCFGVTDTYFIREVSIGDVVESSSAGSYTTENVVVNLGALVNDCILTNNGLITGISLPGGIILATEWNSVDDKNIYFPREASQEFFVIYKNINSGKWYKIKEDTPKLKLCNNQIVSNVNYYKNSFDLDKQSSKLFAPAWNNRAIFSSVLPSAISSSIDATKNNYYTAKSINEFNLADNSSILLNPIPVIVVVRNDTYPYEWDTIENEVFVNNYVGTNDNNILYLSSFLLNYKKNGRYVFFTNRNLMNLPFPSDTNGNVAYSPSLFTEFISSFGNDVFVREGSNTYQLSRSNNQPIMSYYLGTLIEGLTDVFILQGQYYGIINNQIFSIQFYNGVVASQTSVVSVEGLQFCGNTPYEALFFSKTNRCLYSFTGANILQQKQFVDKIKVVKSYKYNPATQSIFLLTDIGVIVSSLFGIYQIEMPEAEDMFLLDNGIVLTDNLGNYRYVRYYKEDVDEDYVKQNIQLETCFYGMNNQTVTINDCLYMRLFSEEHEQGELEVSATTISNTGRVTEKTTFRIRAKDWDKETNTIYLRYQPKEQRGLGISFKINSPFKIAALSVGSIADAILIDKVSKGAINAPAVKSQNVEW